mmetsp:Transcript_21345/g.51747  ORF Transcript_21345/g.51747 Transcript_21345/m.51747 type:complete len:483 (-) Transcript_21345:156-1604(-)
MRVSLASATVAVAADLSFIHSAEVGDPHFYDEHGRVRIFHGCNRVQKSFPWYFPHQVGSDNEPALMKKMGFNVLRLGWMWSGFNPAPGVFNQTYLEIVQGIVDRFGKHGIYVLLDMHEDVLSSKFCTYDGAPQWVINKSQPKHAFPWPLKGNCSRPWEQNMFAEASLTAYQDIYDNNHGMLDDLTNFWEHSAEAWVGNPAIIGYETINEPFAGNIYEDPTLLLPGVAGSKNLQRTHDAIAKAIRKHDDRHMVFYEPVTWGMLFNGKIAGSGFSHVPGGPEYQNRSAFSYHYYCDSFVPGYETDPSMRSLLCDHITGPLVFEAVKQDLAHLGGAAMMTEGLACNYHGKDNPECRVVMGNLDRHIFSWTDYGHSQGETFDPEPDQQQEWARSYAQAVAGQPVSMDFNPDSREFEFCYTLDLGIKAPTEIFASQTYSYPHGMDISAPSSVTVDTSQEDTVKITPAAGAKTGDKVCIGIKRKGIVV